MRGKDKNFMKIDIGQSESLIGKKHFHHLYYVKL